MIDDPDRDQDAAFGIVGDIADEKFGFFALSKDRALFFGGAEIGQAGQQGLKCGVGALQFDTFPGAGERSGIGIHGSSSGWTTQIGWIDVAVRLLGSKKNLDTCFLLSRMMGTILQL